MLIVSEPYNAYDSNALSVLLHSGNGPVERAIYLKREAVALAPWSWRASPFPPVSCGWIYEDREADGEVRVK